MLIRLRGAEGNPAVEEAFIGRDWYDGTCLLYLVVKGKTLGKSGSLPPLIIPVTSHDIENGRLTPPM